MLLLGLVVYCGAMFALLLLIVERDLRAHQAAREAAFFARAISDGRWPGGVL